MSERDPKGFSLSRWSRRKLEAAKAAKADENAGRAVPPAPATADVPSSPVAAATAAPAPVEEAPLPPVESLTFDDDFTAFLKPRVDEATRRQALRKLFSDERFNVMDGLDVYIDDYSKTVPIPEDVVRQLAHARYIFDPPKTRITAEGYVEDVPEDELVAEAPQDTDEARSAPGADAEEAPTDARDAAEQAPLEDTDLIADKAGGDAAERNPEGADQPVAEVPASAGVAEAHDAASGPRDEAPADAPATAPLPRVPTPGSAVPAPSRR